MLRYLAIRAIRLYQKTLSPDHGWLKGLYPNGCCRFYPTCSEYTAQAITVNGVFVGITQGIWRILRCNPFSNVGRDYPRKIKIPEILKKI